MNSLWLTTIEWLIAKMKIIKGCKRWGGYLYPQMDCVVVCALWVCFLWRKVVTLLLKCPCLEDNDSLTSILTKNYNPKCHKYQ